MSPAELSLPDEAPPVGRPPPSRQPIGGVPVLTQVTRSFGLLGLEGLGVGLLAWGARASWRLGPYTIANKITAKGRAMILANMFGIALAGCLVAGVYLLWRRRAGLAVVDAVARRLAPLIVVGLLPFLLNWSIWSGRDLTFLVLASLMVLGLRPLLTMSLAAPPLLGDRPLFTRVGVAWDVFRARHAGLFRALPLAIVCAGAVYYAVFFSYHTVANHRNILTTSLDLGLEDNLVWNALHGGALFKSSPYTGPTGTHGGNHVTFFAYAIAVVYFFAQRAETLLVLQAVLLGGAALPLFLFARRHLGPWKACLVSLCYLLYPPLHGANLYDFHYLPLGPFFLWLTLYALEARRNVLSVIAVILTLSVREDVAAGLGIVGAYLLLSGERPKAGLIVAALGSAYFVALKLVIMPHLIAASSFLEMYAGLLPNGETGFGGVLKTVIANPAFTLNTLLERDKLIYFLQIAVPLAFIPFRRSLGILCCLPGFVFTLLSTGYVPLYQTSFQYTAHWTAYLFIVLVLTLAWLGKRDTGQPDNDGGVARNRHAGDGRTKTALVRQRAWMISLAAASVIMSHQYGALLQQNTVRGGFGVYKFGTTDADRARHDALYSLIAQIPPRAKVAGTETVVPHISNRPDAYTARIGIFDAEYLLFILPTGGEEGRHVAAGLSNGTYGVVAIKEPFALAKKGFPTAANASVMLRISH